MDFILYGSTAFFILAMLWLRWEDKNTDINFKHSIEALHVIFKYNLRKVADGKADETISYDDAWRVRRNWFYRSKSFWDYIDPKFHDLKGLGDK